ncbi:MAG: DNA primase [Clostridiales bacterium]|nr:DNA primase [Clostridiales bacterium]
MRYDDSIIEQVRSSNDIVDIVGRYVRLTKKGSNYFGLCPFHGEKTPSFSVSPRKQIYYCFGCGAGGNVISFLMEYENYSFTEALKALADNAHIELPETSEDGTEERKELRQTLLSVNKEAALYYHSVLRSGGGSTGYEYLNGKRRLTNSTIVHFGLGFAGKSSDSLYKHLRSRGYSDDVLSLSGLVTFTEKGVRDKFWNRVMFPIMDTNNRVIGFGGRVMGDGEPKYLNSPETLIFDKSSTLYGLNFAKRSREKFLLLCEGYMDVIALHQAGFTNAVASLGTAFTEKHARLLKRYTDTVYLTQDSDKAGISAKLRAFPILHGAGLKVKVIDMGDFKDPDEFIRARGSEAYSECIRKAKNAFIYVIGILRSGYDLSDPAEKTAYIRETAEKLCMFSDTIERDSYIDAVSVEYMIDRDELKRLVDRMVENGLINPSKNEISITRRPMPSRQTDGISVGLPDTGRLPGAIGSPVTEGLAVSEERSTGDIYGSREGMQDPALIRYEKMLTAWIAERPYLLDVISRYIDTERFSVRVYRMIIKEAAKALSKTSEFSPAAFLDRSDLTETDRKYAAEVFSGTVSSGGLENMSRQEIEKGLTEAVRAVLTSDIEKQMSACGSDVRRFGELIREMNSLKDLEIRIPS